MCHPVCSMQRVGETVLSCTDNAVNVWGTGLSWINHVDSLREMYDPIQIKCRVNEKMHYPVWLCRQQVGNALSWKDYVENDASVSWNVTCISQGVSSSPSPTASPLHTSILFDKPRSVHNTKLRKRSFTDSGRNHSPSPWWSFTISDSFCTLSFHLKGISPRKQEAVSPSESSPLRYHAILAYQLTLWSDEGGGKLTDTCFLCPRKVWRSLHVNGSQMWIKLTASPVACNADPMCQSMWLVAANSLVTASMFNSSKIQILLPMPKRVSLTQKQWFII